MSASSWTAFLRSLTPLAGFDAAMPIAMTVTWLMQPQAAASGVSPLCRRLCRICCAQPSSVLHATPPLPPTLVPACQQHHPGGHLSWRPPMTCACRWYTLWPACAAARVRLSAHVDSTITWVAQISGRVTDLVLCGLPCMLTRRVRPQNELARGAPHVLIIQLPADLEPLQMAGRCETEHAHEWRAHPLGPSLIVTR